MTFTPRATTGARPFYWPLFCCPVLAPKDRLPFSHWFAIVASKKYPLGSVSLFFQWLSSCLLPCSGSSLGLSKTIQLCHVAKSFWHPFSMLIRGMLWIFIMLPWVCKSHIWREGNYRYQLFCVTDMAKTNVKWWPKLLEHLTYVRGFCCCCFNVKISLWLLILKLMERPHVTTLVSKVSGNREMCYCNCCTNSNNNN